MSMGKKKNLWMLAEMDRQQDDQNFEEAEQGQKNTKKQLSKLKSNIDQ